MSDQINVNQIADILNNKVDLPADKNQADIDYVIETKLPTASDTTWYRLYKSGWIEQGGIASLPAQGANTVAGATLTLPKEMYDSYYNFSAQRSHDGGNTYELTQVSVQRSTTQISVNYFTTVATNGASLVCIIVNGMSAQGGIS